MIIGQYVNGIGKFHFNLDQFEKIFGYPMIGSFNVKTDIPITNFQATFGVADKFNHINATGGILFWFVRLNYKYIGWAVRWGGSRQKETTWEIISREAFPDELKSGPIIIETASARGELN